MQTVSLSIQQSWELGAVLLAGGAAASLSGNSKVRTVGAAARETSIIGFLYGLWQYAGSIAKTGHAGGYSHAHTVMRIEHDLRLPSERDLQHLILGHRLLVETINLYYATMHFTVMLIFLVWLFVRHRDRYRPIRQVMAWTTLACLLVQMIPVAPPRMLPGFVDTAELYGQSVYKNGLPIDQLSAMPSVHVAWAVLVGFYVWRVSPSRWRWIGPAHSVATVFVVVSTANHWWLDGIVAVLLLTACAWGVAGVRAGWQAARAAYARRRTPPEVEPVAEPVPAG